ENAGFARGVARDPEAAGPIGERMGPFNTKVTFDTFKEHMQWQLRALTSFFLAISLASAGCRSKPEGPSQAERARKVEEAQQLMREAQQLLTQERYEDAARSAQKAGLLLKNDAASYLLLFEIRRAEGNTPAAALALKQAADFN